MKRLLIALLLFSSPVFAEKYTIYTTERPPFSWSGVIDSEDYYYDFTNSGIDKCDIVARGYFIKKFVKIKYLALHIKNF